MLLASRNLHQGHNKAKWRTSCGKVRNNHSIFTYLQKPRKNLFKTEKTTNLRQTKDSFAFMTSHTQLLKNILLIEIFPYFEKMQTNEKNRSKCNNLRVEIIIIVLGAIQVTTTTLSWSATALLCTATLFRESKWEKETFSQLWDHDFPISHWILKESGPFCFVSSTFSLE